MIASFCNFSPQAVAAPVTIVLRLGSMRTVDPKITRTLVAETPSLRATPMWYVIYYYYLLPLVSDTDPVFKITSTGRGGAGNIRSPSRDPVRGGNATPETSPIRSEHRGRVGYDSDLISTIDSVRDEGVVRGSHYL